MALHDHQLERNIMVSKIQTIFTRQDEQRFHIKPLE